MTLRLFDRTNGAPVPTRLERVEKERLRAEEERRNAEQERVRADSLAAEVERLKALLEQTRSRAAGGGSEE